MSAGKKDKEYTGHSRCCGKDMTAVVTSRGSLTWSSSSSMSSRIPLEKEMEKKKTSLRLAQSPMETHTLPINPILFPSSVKNIIWMNSVDFLFFVIMSDSYLAIFFSFSFSSSFFISFAAWSWKKGSKIKRKVKAAMSFAGCKSMDTPDRQQRTSGNESLCCWLVLCPKHFLWRYWYIYNFFFYSFEVKHWHCVVHIKTNSHSKI